MEFKSAGFFAYYESSDKRLYFMQACLQRNIDIWLAKLYEYVGLCSCSFTSLTLAVKLCAKNEIMQDFAPIHRRCIHNGAKSLLGTGNL